MFAVSELCDLELVDFCMCLEQRSEKFSSKGPDSKYFRLCRLYGLCCNYPTLLL